MSEAHTSLIRDYLTAYNASDWSHLELLVAPDYVHHSGNQRLTFDQFVAGATAFKRALPDLRLVLEDLLADEEKVVARYAVGGTHLAPLGDEEPTGRQVVLQGITIFRLVEGRIAEDGEAVDELGLLRQLGIVG